MGTKQSESGGEREGEERVGGCVHNAITGAAVSGMEQRRAEGRKAATARPKSRPTLGPIPSIHGTNLKTKTKVKLDTGRV